MNGAGDHPGTAPVNGKLRAECEDAPDSEWRFPGAMVLAAKDATYSSFLPPLHQPFVLHDDVEFARRKLFEKGGADDMPYCAMITGAQASGKSSVAAALARHPAMRTRYPHGAAWVHCGPGATPDSTLRHLLELVRAVQCASQAGTTPYLVDIAQSGDAMADELSQRLATSELLLVLDDVPGPAVVRACLTLGPHLLVTTKVAGLPKKLRSAIASAGVRTYDMRPLPAHAARTLLQTHFDFSKMAPERIEGLIGHLGRLPLEVVLASFLFQLVGTYVEFKADALVEAIVARLDSAHDNLQEQMSHESAVQHLSPSHLYCWRTLAVTLELFPTLYRKCLFQLVRLPPGALVTGTLLSAIWDAPAAELPAITSMLATVSVLAPVPGPEGQRWFVTNLAREYLVYWARVSGKAADIGRLQQWLLANPRVAARVCNPHSQTGHAPLLRPMRASGEMELLARNAVILSDEALAAAAAAVAAAPVAGAAGAAHALSLAAAALEARLAPLAVRLVAAAAKWHGARGAPAALTCQLRFTAARAHLAAGDAPRAIEDLEQALALAAAPATAAALGVQSQIVGALIECARRKGDRRLVLSLCRARVQLVQQHASGGAHDAAALIELVHAQIANHEAASEVKKTLKGARPIVEGVCTRFTLLKLALERAVLAYYLYIGRMDSVESKICKLYMTVQQIHDPYHCTSAQLMADIALCLNLQGNFVDARDMLRETLAVLARSPATAATQATAAMAHSNLAVSLLATGAASEALAHVRGALELLEGGAGEELPAKPTMYARAAVLTAIGEYGPAQALLRQLAAHYSAPATRSAAAAAAALESLGTAALLARQWPAAAEALQESLAMHAALVREQPARPAAGAEVAKVHFLLGIVFSELGQLEKAAAHARQFESLQQAHANHPCLLWAADIPAFEESVAALRKAAESGGGGAATAAADAAGTDRDVPGTQPRVLLSDPEFENALPP